MKRNSKIERINKKVVQINIDVPEQMRRELKSKAALLGIPMNQMLSTAFAEFINLDEKTKRELFKNSKMVRDTGFEPVTPTVSKFNPNKAAFPNPHTTISFGQKALLPRNPADKQQYDMLELSASKPKPCRRRSYSRRNNN